MLFPRFICFIIRSYCRAYGVWGIDNESHIWSCLVILLSLVSPTVLFFDLRGPYE
jgi:hypothetical protein